MLLMGDALVVLVIRLLGFPNALQAGVLMMLIKPFGLAAVMWVFHVYLEDRRDPAYNWGEWKLHKE